MMNNTRKPSLEHLEDRNLMSTITINWVPTITSFQYGTKLGPAELNASVNSTGPQNPPVAPLLYLDQNGNGVGMGTVLPAGQDTITAYYGAYATATQTFTVTGTPAPLASPSLTPDLTTNHHHSDHSEWRTDLISHGTALRRQPSNRHTRPPCFPDPPTHHKPPPFRPQ